MTHVAPSFSLARGAWVPRVVTWDADTGDVRRIEGPEGLATYPQALEASRFLRVRHG